MAVMPPDNALQPRLAGASFVHCAAIALPSRPASALQVYLDMARLAPRWLEALMALRNLGMRLAGMKHLGRIADVDTPQTGRPGERIGIFTVLRNDADQLVLGDSDRHLEVALALQLRTTAAGTSLHCATVVERPTLFGRLYMLPVAPLHRCIVPLLLRRYARGLRAPAHRHHAAGDGPTSRSPS